MKFYVYEWYNIDTNEVFYVGKGCKNRYKEIKKRNKKFLEYYENNNVNVKIVKFFDNEDEAFAYEKELTDKYREKNQCKCNLIDGGYGGFSKIWNDETRDYYSKNNVMKRPEQRQRMSENNPMKNLEIAKKVGEKHKRKVIINNKIFNGVVDAAEYFGVHANTIVKWCKRGYDTNHNPCRYFNEIQKEIPTINKNKKACIIDGVYYNSLKEGAESIGGNSSNLIRAIKENRTYKGHKVEYANQQPS